MENTVLVTLTGKNATIDLLNDRIIITKRAKSAEASQQNGEQAVEILLATITSTKIENGYLQIFTASFSKSITFSATSANAFQLFKLELDRLTQVPASAKSLEELQILEKMGELKDKGFITEEEFNAKKRQVFDKGIDLTNVENIKKAMESALAVEEQEKNQQLLQKETAQKTQVEGRRRDLKITGIAIAFGYLLFGCMALVSGAFLNGFFMLLTAIILTPLIHLLAKQISKDQLQHVPATFRIVLVLLTMFLSTLHYFENPTQVQAASEASTSLTQTATDTSSSVTVPTPKYEIVKTEDTSFKLKDGHYGLIPAEEMAELPTVKRMVYTVLVPFTLSRSELSVTIDGIIKDITTEDPDIDEFRMFVYNDKAMLKTSNYAARVEWVPGGSYANMTEDIARNNNRETYQTEIVIADDLEEVQKAATSNVTKYGLSEATRKQAYKETMANSQRATDEADRKYPIGSDKNLPYQQSLLEKYDAKTQKKYHLTEDQLFDIAVEGDTKHWPKLEPPIVD